MRNNGGLGYAPNYTNAFLVMLGINMMIWGIFVLVKWGIIGIMFLFSAADIAIKRWVARQPKETAAADTPPDP